eukprot:363897-Chlamydomonas_euryale.AAC.25
MHANSDVLMSGRHVQMHQASVCMQARYNLQVKQTLQLRNFRRRELVSGNGACVRSAARRTREFASTCPRRLQRAMLNAITIPCLRGQREAQRVQTALRVWGSRGLSLQAAAEAAPPS